MATSSPYPTVGKGLSHDTTYNRKQVRSEQTVPRWLPTRPGSIKRAFREKVEKTGGRGRACLVVWPELCIATVIKHVKNKRVVEITRKMTLGTLAQAQQLLQATLGGSELNTAFIERFNGSATSTYLLTLSEATNKGVCW